MRTTFSKRELVLAKTTQTRLLKTGLKQFGSIISDIPASNARHGVLFTGEDCGEQQRLGTQIMRNSTKTVSVAVQQTAFELFLQQQSCQEL
jgi:hypothetical protein